jgi:hypothetical protein
MGTVDTGPAGAPPETVPAGPPPTSGLGAAGTPGGAPPDQGPGEPGRPGAGLGDRPPLHRPPFRPPPWQPPWWWWQVPEDTDVTEPTCQGQLLPRDAPTPPPFQYQGQTVSPLFDPNQQQWGFWFGKKWIPLYQSGC